LIEQFVELVVARRFKLVVRVEGEIIELTGQNNLLVERTRELEVALKTKKSLVFSENV
jgi:hypothetical protein